MSKKTNIPYDKETRAWIDAADSPKEKTHRLWKAKYARHKEKYKARERAQYAENPQKHIDERLAWQKKYPAKAAAASAAYKTRKLRAMPAWANEFFIEQAYELAQLRSKMFGFKWHVDHIIPLHHKKVCGLHVHENLQVIPGSLNCSKGNNWRDGYER